MPATTISEEGWKYRVVYTNPVGAVTSNSATLFVHTIPSVSLQPSPVLVAVGAEAHFESTATGNPPPTEQWEVSTNHGASWSAISGATSAKFTIATAQASENGHLIRATFKNSAGTISSTAARLTVASTDYAAFGWGGNKKGEVGNGSNENFVPTPASISGLSFVTAVSSGLRHSLSLRADGSVFAWGSNGFGQLGIEAAVNVRSPEQIPGISNATAISAGGQHSLVLLEDGTVRAFGNDEFGQVGNGTFTELIEKPVAVQGLSNVVAISAGEDHSLALLSNGTVWAWGNDEHGQLGNGATRNSDVPVQVTGLTGVKAIATGGQFSMALLEDGKVEAWGFDGRGQIGNLSVLAEETETAETSVPVEVEGLSGVTAIAAGRDHALALLESGKVDGWGDDSEGEVGNGARTSAVRNATEVSGLTGVKQISAGNEESAAVLGSGAVMSWGQNSSGNLGIGTVGEGSDVPVPVTGLAEAVGVDAGGSHMLALGEATPAVSSISPAAGPLAGGGVVHITGLNFGGASAVHFGATAASTFTVESPTAITATAPAGTGTVNVTVTSAAGTSSLVPDDRYTYRQAPTVTKLSAKTGPAGGGTTVTISGTEFTGATGVSFGGAPVKEFTVVAPGTITAVTGPGVAGTVYVTVTGIGGTSAPSSKGKFKYVPSVESLSPANGPHTGGTSVVITGTGFAPGVGTTVFKFGKVKVTTAECESETTCTATAPAQKAAGAVNVVAYVNKTKSSANPGDLFTAE